MALGCSAALALHGRAQLLCTHLCCSCAAQASLTRTAVTLLRVACPFRFGCSGQAPCVPFCRSCAASVCARHPATTLCAPYREPPTRSKLRQPDINYALLVLNIFFRRQRILTARTLPELVVCNSTQARCQQEGTSFRSRSLEVSHQARSQTAHAWSELAALGGTTSPALHGRPTLNCT